MFKKKCRAVLSSMLHFIFAKINILVDLEPKSVSIVPSFYRTDGDLTFLQK